MRSDYTENNIEELYDDSPHYFAILAARVEGDWAEVKRLTVGDDSKWA